MSQEATMIAVDNSDYMRNGDFVPSRLQAQNDAVSLVCQCKRQSNPENTIGLLSLANTEVLCTLTNDIGKIYNRLHLVEPKGNISFGNSVRIAHLALRHRQLRHQKMRIVCFVGSPISDDEKEMVKLAKRLKKEKVNVDVINFGENEVNQKRLSEFIDTLNGKEGSGSHLVTVPPGAVLHDSLVTSPIIAGEDGAGAIPGAGLGLEFGLDAADDPDLLYALRVSMEDQRMRQEHEANTGGVSAAVANVLPGASGTSEEAMLQQALAMSMQTDDRAVSSRPVGVGLPMELDLAGMSEEDQIAYALQMSLQHQQRHDESAAERKPDAQTADVSAPLSMEVEEHITGEAKPSDEAAAIPTTTAASDLDAMYDPEFLQSVLQNLPGVDTQNENVRKAINALTKQRSKDSSDKDKSDKKDDEPGPDQTSSGV